MLKSSASPLNQLFFLGLNIIFVRNIKYILECLLPFLHNHEWKRFVAH